MGVREIDIKIYMYIYEKIYLLFGVFLVEWKGSGKEVGKKWACMWLIVNTLHRVCGKQVESKWAGSG